MNSENSEIILHNSHWINNIGNAFFTLGVKHIIEKATEKEIEVTQTDQLATLAWRHPYKRISKNDIKYPMFSKPDWFVLSGPLFNKNFVREYTPILEEVFKNNKKTELVLMNCGSIDYSTQEIVACKKFLDKFKPFLITTRDQFTYETYKDFSEHVYNGIDTALFCGDYYHPYHTPKLGDYVSVCFDKKEEPRLNLEGYALNKPSTWQNFKVLGNTNKKRSRVNDLLGKNLPKKINGYTVVRPTHKLQGRSGLEIFSRPNTFASMTPYGYLNIYANTSLTVSDRVHACLATLGYGKPAHLISKTKRKALFERLLLNETENGIITLDKDWLEKEKKEYINFISSVFKKYLI